MRLGKVRFAFSVPVNFFREGKTFIAYSPVLDLSTSGGSFEEAKKRFREVVGIFFEELIKKGTLDEVLSGLGWQKKRREWLPPALIATQLTEVDFKTNAAGHAN